MQENEKKLTEKRAIDVLLNAGMTFTVERRGIMKYLRKSGKKLTIKPPYLGTLDYITREFLKMDVTFDQLKDVTLAQSMEIASKHTRTMSRIIAMAILNGKWQIKLFTGPLSRWLMWRITPAMLYQLTVIISTLCDTGNFTNSIRLISGTRTTTPRADLVEQKHGG